MAGASRLHTEGDASPTSSASLSLDGHDFTPPPALEYSDLNSSPDTASIPSSNSVQNVALHQLHIPYVRYPNRPSFGGTNKPIQDDAESAWQDFMTHMGVPDTQPQQHYIHEYHRTGA